MGAEDVTAGRGVGSALHLIQTLPGMLTVIVAAVAGFIGALAALAIAVPPLGMAVAAVAGFAFVIVLMGQLGKRSVGGLSPSLEPRFPSPGS